MRRNPSSIPVFNHSPLGVIFLLVAILSIVSLACNFSIGAGDKGVQQTAAAEDSRLVANSVQLTLDARFATQPATLPPAPVPAATEPAPPTEAPPPPTEAVPTDTPAPEPVNIDTQIQNAKILLYEDAGAAGLKREVMEALDRGGYSYTDVAGEIGRFKTELTSGTKWDLIISAAEARSYVRGEFFDYMNDSLNDGGSVIVETWYLDEIIRGKVSALMDRCGFRLFKDWENPDKDSRSIFWLQPDHPLLAYPNSGISLVHYGPYWETGDVGDFLMSTSSSNGVLVAGNVSYRKNDYGTIGVCDDGRLIIQTFSSHDYKSADMINLWQNYIYYTLKNHFEFINNK
jgi:hypothetical protein